MAKDKRIDEKLKRLLDLGLIICGRKYEDEGFVRFERVQPEKIETIPPEKRAYATASMGRAIFTIDENGNTHNIKGVDSNIDTNELGPMELLNANAILFSQGKDKYTISALVFNEEKPEIRIKGTSSFEDINQEGKVADSLKNMGIKTQNIQDIHEFTNEYCIKYGLPIKKDGIMPDYDSEKQKTELLKKIYGDKYVAEIEETKRPETMKEYLERIGFTSSQDVIEKIKSLGYFMEDFILGVDTSYVDGQRYGQIERILGSPFRISDIELYVKHKDVEKLQAIFNFSEEIDEDFTKNLAVNYGKNIAKLMNNGWFYEALYNRQDFALSGEFCDDAYLNLKEFDGNSNPLKLLQDSAMNKYKTQIMHGASCIKIVQDAMRMLGKDEKSIQSVLDTFLNSFVDTIDYKSIGEEFEIDANEIEDIMITHFSEKKKWTELMSTEYTKDGEVRNNAIYNANINYEEYYQMISEKLEERFKVKKANRGLQEIAESDEAFKYGPAVFGALQRAILSHRNQGLEQHSSGGKSPEF